MYTGQAKTYSILIKYPIVYKFEKVINLALPLLTESEATSLSSVKQATCVLEIRKGGNGARARVISLDKEHCETITAD